MTTLIIGIMPQGKISHRAFAIAHRIGNWPESRVPIGFVACLRIAPCNASEAYAALRLELGSGYG